MPYTKTREFHDAQMQAIQSAIMSKAIADQLLSPAEHNPSQSWGVAMALLQAAFKKGVNQ